MPGAFFTNTPVMIGFEIEPPSASDFSATARISLRIKQGVILPEPRTVPFPELPGS